MLRIGLTGDLGSGKSTVARMLAERGAVVFSSDEMGRKMMRPGEAVYARIVEAFGPGVVARDGELDRRALAAVAFDPVHPRVEELNAIVHPAVIEEQERLLEELEAKRPEAVAVVESALIFSTKYAEVSWRTRFDRVLLVTAPEVEKVRRYMERAAAGRVLSANEKASLEADAQRRLAVQLNDEYAGDCLVLHNDGDIEQLEAQVVAVWGELKKKPV
jgi:dephospho-CoA kinase